jgi:hypothetical protein
MRVTHDQIRMQALKCMQISIQRRGTASEEVFWFFRCRYFPIKILYSYDEKIRQFEVTPQEGQSWTTTSVEDLTKAVASRLRHDDVEPLHWVLAYPFKTEINGVSHSRIEWIANHLELDSLYCLERFVGVLLRLIIICM